MKVLLTGGKGMLGRTIVRELGAEFEVVPTDLPDADITDENGFDALLKRERPDVVIHCAAMTAVDKCEEAVDFAYKLNARGTANVAAACNRNGIRLIAISTDYVFDGDADRPYNEFDRTTGGNTVYGKSKFAGEELSELLKRPNLCGTFHMTCEGEATWAEFAEEIFRLAGKEQRIQPCTTASERNFRSVKEPIP